MESQRISLKTKAYLSSILFPLDLISFSREYKRNKTKSIILSLLCRNIMQEQYYFLLVLPCWLLSVFIFNLANASTVSKVPFKIIKYINSINFSTFIVKIQHKLFWENIQHILYINTKDKRAQRALGRSPEEKVKCHNGANNREPQGHNLNNFGRRPLDDAIYQIWKLWAL